MLCQRNQASIPRSIYTDICPYGETKEVLPFDKQYCRRSICFHLPFDTFTMPNADWSVNFTMRRYDDNKVLHGFLITPKRGSLRREKLAIDHISGLQETIQSRPHDINRKPPTTRRCEEGEEVAGSCNRNETAPGCQRRNRRRPGAASEEDKVSDGYLMQWTSSSILWSFRRRVLLDAPNSTSWISIAYVI